MSTSDVSCKDGASTSNDKDDVVCEVNDMLQNMNTVDNEVNDTSLCANCGKGEEEGSKLKTCPACKMVKYCNRKCQIAHRPQHKKECRKRKAELHDIELFKQPPSAEDCPICFLRMPSLSSGCTYMPCCGKEICNGCVLAPVYDDQGNEVDSNKCPFCRIPTPTSNEEANRRREKRVEAGDAVAMFYMGCKYRDGTKGYPQDYAKALKLFHKAGELGHAIAYASIGYAYNYCQGVEIDLKKAMHYYELAAMAGDVYARYNLGTVEENICNEDRALKHYMIAARGGNSESLDAIKYLYSMGHATKEDYMEALRSYQAYLGEIKSVQRDKAAAADEKYRYY